MKIAILSSRAGSVKQYSDLVAKIEGCAAVGFDDPNKLLAWGREHEPDMVIVDVLPPPLNGLAFLSAFRAMHARDAVPVIMVAGAADRKFRLQALVAGANDYLLEPVDKIEFSTRTRNLLALRENHCFQAQRNEWLTRAVEKATADILERERETLFRISRAAEFRDPETGAHIHRMAHYSHLVARGLDLPQHEQKLILDASPLHDVGKIGIPDAILLKPGKLTLEEFEVMKYHARYGYNLLNGSASKVVQTGAEIALAHHEKFDGSGYPNGLSGDDIPMFGRIVAIADVFDALTSVRPYKKAWTLDAAATYLREQVEHHFDPYCVAAFLNQWDEVLAINKRFEDA